MTLLCVSLSQKAVLLFFILALCHSGVRVGELCQALSNHYHAQWGLVCMSLYFSGILEMGFTKFSTGSSVNVLQCKNLGQ